MFDVGIPEMLVIVVVAIVVFGPERLPEFARQAGRLVRRLRLLAQGAQEELRRELGPEYANLELRDLDPRTALRKAILEAAEADVPPVSTARAAALAPGERPPYDVEAT